MSEKDMRRNVIRYGADLDAIAVENPAYPGTPDVNCIGDWWLELKWLRAWPKPETPVRLEHYTQQQKLWMRRRILKGGKAALLLQCRREWFMFTYPGLMVVGELTKEELMKTAANYTDSGMTKERFKQWLS